MGAITPSSRDALSQRQTDLNRVSLFEFQEPINCSNITSIAYALSALGYPTTVDEVIYNSGTPVRDVTDLGVRSADRT